MDKYTELYLVNKLNHYNTQLMHASKYYDLTGSIEDQNKLMKIFGNVWIDCSECLEFENLNELYFCDYVEHYNENYYEALNDVIDDMKDLIETVIIDYKFSN